MKESKNTSECAVKERPILFSGAMVRAGVVGGESVGVGGGI